MTKSKPKVEPIDWTESLKRIMNGWSLLNPLVLPKIQAAIDLERANKGAGEQAFKDACKDLIKDKQLLDSLWHNIAASLVNPINGYCW